MRLLRACSALCLILDDHSFGGILYKRLGPFSGHSTLRAVYVHQEIAIGLFEHHLVLRKKLHIHKSAVVQAFGVRCFLLADVLLRNTVRGGRLGQQLGLASSLQRDEIRSSLANGRTTCEQTKRGSATVPRSFTASSRLTRDFGE